MHKILIAEDEAVIAIELERTLVAMGYEVVGTAGSGQQAIEMARRLKPDLILMDIVMPGDLDGIAAAEIIKEEMDISVIFLTAYAGDQLIQRAKHVEPFGYIVKPFQEDQVRAAIEIAIYKNQMEKRLRQSEERYRGIVNTAQEGIYVVDAQVRIDFVNRKLADMLGYTVEEMLGRYLVDFMDDVAPVDMYKTVQGDKEDIKETHDFRFRRKDGLALWGMVSSSPIYDEEGRFVGGLGMVIDVTERKRAERALRKANEELEGRVRERTAKLSESNLLLRQEVDSRKQAEERILALSQQLVKAQEIERQKISRDLHDSIAQDLTAAKMALDTLFDEQPETDPRTKQRVGELSKKLQATVVSIRHLTYQLGPTGIDEIGLVQAVREQCQDFSAENTLKVDFSASEIEESQIEADAKIIIYRLIQECLNNVKKHADASQVSVHLVESSPDVLIVIEDDGKGFDAQKQLTGSVDKRHMGLRGIKETVSVLRGSLEIDSGPGRGTRIVVKVHLLRAE